MKAAGKLKDRVSIQRATETLDSYGGSVKTWNTVSSRWAEVWSRQGQESAEGTELKYRYFYTVRLRYLEDLKPTDRLLFNGKTLEIISINHSPKDDSDTEILAKETA